MCKFGRAIAVAILFLCVRESQAQDESQLTRRILRDAPTAWRRYQEKTVHLNGHYTLTMTKDGNVFARSRNEVRLNSRCKLMKVDILHGKDQGEAILYCSNPAYVFTLVKKPNNPAWGLKDAGADEKNRAFIDDNRLRSLKHGVDGLIRLNSHVDLLELVAYPTFQILSAASVQQDGRDLVEIKFDNTHEVHQEPFCPIQKGILVLDPALFWCLRSYQVQHVYYPDGVGTARLEVTLQEAPGGYPIPKRIAEIAHTESAKERWKMNMVTEKVYDVAEARPAPDDDEFSLTAFGIPEPTGTTWPKQSRWYLWFIAMAIASLSVGWLLWRRASQGAKMPSANSLSAKPGA